MNVKKEKLVRDKIQQLSIEKNDGRIFRTAQDSEMAILFSNKLLEESNEVKQELTKETLHLALLTEEIADVLEVISAIQNHYKISESDILKVKLAKAEKKGGFNTKLVLDIT